MKRTSQIKTILFLALLVFSWSCRDKEDTLPAVDPGSNSAVNRWIYSIMEEAYLWLDNLGTPISENSTPEDYFEALLYRPTDRFSVIYPDYAELLNSLSGINLESGYEFILYKEGDNNVIAEISYVKKNSPASDAGLKRGDIIYKINSTQMTVDNYKEVLGDISSTHSIEYLRFNETSSAYEDQGSLTLTPIQLAEDPNFLDSIYTIDNQKIGYVIYHFFAPGPGDNSSVYDDEMDAVFANFKAQNIDHLIIDFRYNGGGYVSSAVNLASLIAPGVSSTSVFSKTKFNSFLMSYDELKNVQTTFKQKAENLGNTLSGNRVYILTSHRTASASELIINGLKPYMDVFLIGDVTVGKNVGSIPFQDEDNDQNNYGILPIVTQSFNSLDQSDYSNGFNPNIITKEVSERMRPLGDINELLLRTAIGEITGVVPSGRFQQLNRKDLESTLDHKARSGRMIESLEIR